MRPLRATVTAVAAMLALAACTGGDDPTDPSTTSTPTGTIDDPSTPPPTEIPVDPSVSQAATKPTKAGARAFAIAFWNVLGSAETSGITTNLETISSPDCVGCQGAIQSIRELYDAGGSAEGEGYNVSVDTMAPRSRQRWTVRMQVRNARQTITSPGEKTQVIKPQRNTAHLVVQWEQDDWRIIYVGTDE